MKKLLLLSLTFLSGCGMIQARYMPQCEGDLITTPCMGYCNILTRGINGVVAKRKLPYAVLITDQEGKIQCQEVDL